MIVLLFFTILISCYIVYHINHLIHVQRYQKSVCFLILCFIVALAYLSSMAMGVFVHLLIGLIIADLFTLVCHKTKFKSFIHTEVIVLVIASILVGYGYVNAKNIHYVSYDVYMEKQCDNKRILAISDLHLSTSIHLADLKDVGKKAKQRQVDMIFILGDLFDERTSKKEAQKAIAYFDTLAKDIPVYYVVGNHDGYQGRMSYQEGLLKQLDESQVIFLKDEVVSVQGLTLIGRLDRSYQRKEISSLIKGIDRKQPLIVLDHQPRDIQENASLGIDLQLSGHTHNGQVWPLGTLCRLLHINEVEYGHVQQAGMDVIVSSGMGTWGFPIKSQGKSEMIEINLKQR